MKERKLGILGKKVGMTRYFTPDGRSLGVTVLELGPCVVLAKRSKTKNEKGRTDGYTALQLGFDLKPERKINKAEAGHLEKAGGKEKARRYVHELRVTEEALAKFEVGQEVTLKDLDIKTGDRIDVVATSKGRGFQGVMHRFDFAGVNTATHGTHEYFRHGGSIGCRKWPGRVFKGRKMPGHMGDKRVTAQNLTVADVRPDENLMLVSGSVPGSTNGYLFVRPAIKKHPLP
ncbi:MAG: 50S ribosomal protein L3 [Deltaproteobacteria bacterium RIFOXYA12_FULL_58_15]|nr:MAG: 50S ribosomal protein L3 [Deltaproteobacteria bacterium RIFOXYA12_FULL_58_15]OGR11207.1 MAG: 50S ribosomal protein L3 [Deltaproteobacteria bacterium RIFOXYB12_FULL_58_9]